MANTININSNSFNGSRGMLVYDVSSDGTALSDTQLIDISALAGAGPTVPGSIKIRTIQATLYGNFILTLEFDATTDQAIAVIENQTADVSFEYVRDFTDGPNGGFVGDTTAAGWTGDLLLTSSGLAASDGFNLVITYDKSTGA